jgi:hypothetical protein
VSIAALEFAAPPKNTSSYTVTPSYIKTGTTCTKSAVIIDVSDTVMRPQTSSFSSFSSLSGASIKSVGTVCISILALYCSQQQDAASAHAQNQNQSNVFTFNKLKSDMDLPRNGARMDMQTVPTDFIDAPDSEENEEKEEVWGRMFPLGSSFPKHIIFLVKIVANDSLTSTLSLIS